MSLRPRFLALLLLFLVPLAGCGGPSEAQRALEAGNSAFNEGNLPTAREQYDHALALDSTLAEAYVNRGIIYRTQNNHRAAVADFDRGLALDPNQPLAHYHRGASRMMMQNFEGGVDDMASALATDALHQEDKLRAHRFRSIGLMNLERYTEAIDDLTQVIALQPTMAINYFDRGQLFEATDKPDQAIADYERALERLAANEPLYTKVQDRLTALQQAQASEAS